MKLDPVLTDSLIAGLACAADKDQEFYWDAECPGFGVRVMPSGAKSFVFKGCVRFTTPRVKFRLTIGAVWAWDIEQAREVARSYRRMTDMGIDPRILIRQRLPGEVR